ncbi:MAG TPA: PEGA domain-containing protein [Kofleriaceae bacterium]|nr:PEGA domain-containing protein [Kofleriaceae bacterium]
MRLLSIAGAAIAAFGLGAWDTPAARADGTGVIAVTTSPEATDATAVRTSIATALVQSRTSPGATTPPRIAEDAVAEARVALAEGAIPIATLERFRRLREQIDEAWRAYLRVQVDFAASRLAAARTDAESLVAIPGGALIYADASLRLGAVLAHLGRTNDSQAALALALALDPDRPITLAEFSPDVVAAVDAVRAQKKPTRTVRITTDPAGSALTIDGRDAGHAPINLDLAVGQHVIVARQPLHQARALAIAVDDAPTSAMQTIDLALERDIAAARLAEGAQPGLPDAASQELADAAVRYADLDEVVLVAATDRRGGPALLVQRCAGLPARCTAVVEVGYGNRAGLAAAAREAWSDVATADLRYPPSVFNDPRVTGKKLDDRCKVCRSPYLWGGVGLAAVVTTIIVVAVVSSSQPPPVLGADPTKF